jgi:hypothetical protein
MIGKGRGCDAWPHLSALRFPKLVAVKCSFKRVNQVVLFQLLRQRRIRGPSLLDQTRYNVGVQELSVTCQARRSYAINCDHHNSMRTILNLTLLAPVYRTRKSAHTDANVAYI